MSCRGDFDAIRAFHAHAMRRVSPGPMFLRPYSSGMSRASTSRRMNAGQAVIESSLRASKLFGVLGPDAFRSLTPHVKRRRFERGARMWRAGEEATWMALITSGLVKI